MISFSLKCAAGRHVFDGWFRSGDDFDTQSARSLVECPVCGSTDIAKALMKPAISVSARSDVRQQEAQSEKSAPKPAAGGGSSVGAEPGPASPAATRDEPVAAKPVARTSSSDRAHAAGGFSNPEAAAKVIKALHAMTRELRAKSDYVGPKFAEEARRIHYGETEQRRIYGEATRDEVDRLGEEGIGAVALPALPEDQN